MASKKSTSAAPDAQRPALKLRMRVSVGELIAVGPGKIALLEALVQTQSITQAAKALGMSYRRAWMLVDELNRALKEPAVATAVGGTHGGGSVVTETGLQLIALYRGIESQAQKAAQADIKRLLAFIAK